MLIPTAMAAMAAEMAMTRAEELVLMMIALFAGGAVILLLAILHGALSGRNNNQRG